MLLVPLSSSITSIIDPTSPELNQGETNKSQTQELSSNKSWHYYIVFVIPLSLLTALTFFFQVYTKLGRSLFDFWHTLFLLPTELIQKNALLEKYIKTLQKRASSRISFF